MHPIIFARQESKSHSKSVKSGIPQGTVLGPHHFLIYINDIDLNLSADTTIRLFADDSLLYREIKSTEDCKALQKDLDTLQEWERKWKMEFHPKKCQPITITKKRKPIKSEYKIHNERLSETKSAKYLGVTIDNELNWKAQNNAVCKKANSSLAFLKRNLTNCPKSIKEKCVNALVKPILDYGCCVWDPHTKKTKRRTRKSPKRMRHAS